MSKFYGSIGFSVSTEIRPGVWDDVTTERTYYGDVYKSIHRYEQSGQANDDINVSNEISIVADPFSIDNCGSMRYVVYLGTKWKIKSIEEQRPRLKLTLGDVWNG